jgi:SAM-dependent methyltransferase
MMDRVFLREDEEGSRVAPWVDPSDSLLDLGAGTGFISRWLRRRTGVEPTLADVNPYPNRERSLPFIHMDDPFHVPVGDGSFDTVMMMFVLHHLPDRPSQERLLDEAVRVARRRLIVAEDTPATRVDLAFNMAWDRLLNLRHRVPTPFTFRDVAEWTREFKERDLSILHVETYRPMWPTLRTYPHTVFVLDR